MDHEDYYGNQAILASITKNHKAIRCQVRHARCAHGEFVNRILNYTCIGHWLYDFYGDHKRRKEEGEEKIEEKIEKQSEGMFCLTGFKGKRRQITDLYFRIAFKRV